MRAYPGSNVVFRSIDTDLTFIDEPGTVSASIQHGTPSPTELDSLRRSGNPFSPFFHRLVQMVTMNNFQVCESRWNDPQSDTKVPVRPRTASAARKSRDRPSSRIKNPLHFGRPPLPVVRTSSLSLRDSPILTRLFQASGQHIKMKVPAGTREPDEIYVWLLADTFLSTILEIAADFGWNKLYRLDEPTQCYTFQFL
jgi:hypothetical protein